MKAMHEAALKRQPIAIQAKAVATTNVPQSTVPMYSLTDFPLLRTPSGSWICSRR
jgi:hypothetical protein